MMKDWLHLVEWVHRRQALVFLLAAGGLVLLTLFGL